ncbi:MAG: hypothetical protein A2X22_14005 [Bacteroidetes bacterium GWF2_49_14]|nr:MAG: hypothetical protein A2X22_14005 [Bacteroidetes bacterium GWF2_49_14]HBB93595.1 hypothetical protein [Bacteroidales bacterium]
MERRGFIRNAALVGTAALIPGSPLLEAQGPSDFSKPLDLHLIPISRVDKPLAIAMWDFSWILRHHKYGEFYDWDRALEGLAERGYNAIRMDAMPQFVASTPEGKILEEYRSPKKDWVPALWGNDFAMDFRPREALLEFLPKCRKYGIRVGLASWFLPHGTDIGIINEEGGLLRAWSETLDFLHSHNLLDDNIVYVDLLNEYPDCNGYEWIKKEMGLRTDSKKFTNDFGNGLIASLKKKYPNLDYHTSFHTWSGLETLELTNYSALDFHVWFHHNSIIGGHIGKAANTAIDRDIRVDYASLMSCWKENKTQLVQWIDGMITSIAKKAADYGIVCGNTEGWGPIGWYDHPDLPWDWVRESAEICVALAKQHSQYKFICSSNFTHPQFKGLWEDVKWHRKITGIIKS